MRGAWRKQACLRLSAPSVRSCPHDGGAESLHQDQPSAGCRAALCGRCHGHRPPVVPHRGAAGTVCLAPEAAEREGPGPGSPRLLHARHEDDQH